VSLLAHTPMTLLPSALGSTIFGIPMGEAMVLPLEGGLDLHTDPPTRAAMVAVAAEHAKFPGTPFTDDRGAKQQRATLKIRELVDRWVAPAYDQLRMARAGQVTG